MGAQFEAFFVEGGEAIGVALFDQYSAAAFFEGLDPDRFGDVGDGFGDAVKRRAVWLSRPIKVFGALITN